jgi:hypothetical protein
MRVALPAIRELRRHLGSRHAACFSVFQTAFGSFRSDWWFSASVMPHSEPPRIFQIRELRFGIQNAIFGMQER